MAERPSDTYESHKEEILDSLKSVEKQLKITNTALVRLDGRRDEIVARRVAMETEIHTAFDKIRKTLDAREAELVAQLEGHTQQQLKEAVGSERGGGDPPNPTRELCPLCEGKHSRWVSRRCTEDEGRCGKASERAGGHV